MKNSIKISNLEKVTFNGEEYSTRIVHIKGYGDRRIAGLGLQGKLIKSEDDTEFAYTSEDAKEIDETIFFYVEDKYLNFGDDKLAAHVEANIA